MSILTIAVSVVLIIIIIALRICKTKKNQTVAKIFGVYSRPGKWYCLKYCIFRTVLFTKKISNDVSKAFSAGNKLIKGCSNYVTREENLEEFKQLSTHEKAFDAVFFQAVSQNGVYFAAGTERRHNAIVNGLVYIAVPEHGLLLSEKLPGTVLNAAPKSVNLMKEYSAEGICFAPVKPMKTWNVSFEGKMRKQSDPNTYLNVSLKAQWTSDLPYFLFDEGIDHGCIARAIAREPWSQQLFQNLKEAHQVHYEQMGTLKGKLTIGNKQQEINLDAFRDHSFGHKRDWTLMHRYIFHMLYLKNGTKISVGVVSQPCTTSSLEMGFVTHPNKTIDPIESCDLILYQHGENGTPGKNVAFSFVANGTTYVCKVVAEYENIHYVGDNVEAKMVERFVKCEVNGVEGRGISEWHYNNVKNKSTTLL